jgi:hypothetical protein
MHGHSHMKAILGRPVFIRCLPLALHISSPNQAQVLSFQIGKSGLWATLPQRLDQGELPYFRIARKHPACTLGVRNCGSL